MLLHKEKEDAFWIGAGTLAAGSFVLGLVVGVGQINLAAGALVGLGVLAFLLGAKSLSKVVENEG